MDNFSFKAPLKAKVLVEQRKTEYNTIMPHGLSNRKPEWLLSAAALLKIGQLLLHKRR